MRSLPAMFLVLAIGPQLWGDSELPPFAQWRSADVPRNYPTPEDYLRVLSRWPKYAETDWRESPEDSSEARYGPGDSSWGMMCHASAMFCYALLATDPGYVPWQDGPNREALIHRLNQGIKFMTRRHVSGDAKCTDGKKWSDRHNKWHSATWAENMGAAADLAWEYLTAENREAVRRVLTWEAERLSAETIPSGDFADTKAESNGWDASVLARTAVMFPSDPRAAKWREKAMEWAMNTLSVPQDAEDETIVDGRPVKEWVRTVNVHRSFASENHGFYHVCYMWWPMWCLASAHYSFASHGQPTPRSMFHHWRDLFSVLKRCYLADGRFAYVSGKDWPRYVYGLTAAMPAYVVLADELDEPAARAMEREAFRRYEWEQLYNGDGSFLGKRFADLKSSGSGGYRAYCRYEADEAIMLGLAYLLHKLKPPRPAPAGEALSKELRGNFECPDAEIVFRRDDTRLVGWSWKTRTGRPQGTIALPDDASLCEWSHNLCGSFDIEGVRASPLITARAQGTIEGGLWATGIVEWGREKPSLRSIPRFLEVVDDNVPTARIIQFDHPIFNKPNKITSLTGLTDLDSIKNASPDWTVLAENERGWPSIVETQVGRGKILICMNDADSAYTQGLSSGRLFENIVAYVKAHSSGSIGYIPEQNSTRQALEQCGLLFETIHGLATANLRRFGAIIMDRGSNHEVRASGWRLVEYAKQGGLLVRFCIQDKQWSPDQLSGARPQGAMTQHIGCLAFPDDRTMAVCELVQANQPVSIRAVSGLNWNIGNDIFNGNQRTIFTGEGERIVQGPGGDNVATRLQGTWLNVDGKVGLAVAGPVRLTLIDRAARTAPHRSYCYETIVLRPVDTPEPMQPRKFKPGSRVLDHITVFYTATGHLETRRLAQRLVRLQTRVEKTSAALVPSPSGRMFVAAWNFNDRPVTIALAGLETTSDRAVRIAAMSAALLELVTTKDEVRLRRLH